jgi:hypothetical protein
VSSPFESVTRVAIAEIITGYAKESKFGYILSPESMRDVVDDLFNLVQTSRSLKAAGDRLIAGGPPPRRETGPGRLVR